MRSSDAPPRAEAPLTRLTPLELATSIVLGEVNDATSLPSVRHGHTPRYALEQAILPALTGPRCLVSFSGGLDSSLVLGVAASVARREGLPLPVPMTVRFRDAEAEESRWQELAIRHLQLPDWQRLDVDDELDLIGPIARRVLLRHGVLLPANAHFHLPLLEAARGGALLTGIDGDGLFSDWRWAGAAGVLWGSIRPVPRHALHVGLAIAPRPLRAAVERHRSAPTLKWLRRGAQRTFARHYALAVAAEPLTWNRRVEWYARQRVLTAFDDTYGMLASDAGASVSHPLLNRDFLASVKHVGSRAGYRNRNEAYSALFGSTLPPALLSRKTKASATAAFHNRYSREFARRDDVDLTGGLSDLVNPAILRQMWVDPAPDARTSALIQAAWLSSARDRERLPSSRG